MLLGKLAPLTIAERIEAEELELASAGMHRLPEPRASYDTIEDER